MRETVKLAIRLMAFALVSALMLAVVNGLTKDTIAKNERDTVNAARAAVLGDYDFEQVETDLTGYPTIVSVYTGTDGDRIVGYVYELQSQGFAGPVSMSLGVDASGTIVGLNVTNHMETKGLGSADEGPFLQSFLGLSAVGATSGGAAAEPTANETTDATAEQTAEATTDATTGATVEQTAEATTDAATGATAEQTAEATTGATTDSSTGATGEAASDQVAGTAVADVDGMTGATYSTNAVKNSVAEALLHFAANYLGGEASAQ